ncbi:MAG: PAS domain S-box protein, partial [Herminiimonas sp.]|nr:PAS domain S-box protein [Herminiimonas sp.]
TIADSTRRIQNNLRPDKLDVFGIKAAISEQAYEFEKSTGVPCKANLPDESLSYDPRLNIALFRMVQETLSNVARHAGATAVTIVLDDNEDEVMLTVRDDGVGIAADRLGDTSVHGLRGLRERANYLGGMVKISDAGARGTTVTMTFPKLPVQHR